MKRTIYNNNIYTASFRGIHGLEGVENQFPRIGEIFDIVVDRQDRMQQRITALEAAAVKNSNFNEDLKRDLIDADNAIEKALNHFRTTAEENRCGK